MLVLSILSAVSFPRTCQSFDLYGHLLWVKSTMFLLCNHKCQEWYDWQFVLALIIGVNFCLSKILSQDV